MIRNGVSVIGVGCTKFGSVLTSPEIKNLTLQELITKAVHEAYDDAGINPKTDIDAFYVGNWEPHASHQYSVNTQVGDWLGLEGKPSVNFATACSTTNTGLGLAANSILSGTFRCVLVTAGEVLTAQAADRPDKPVSRPAWEPLDQGLMYAWMFYGVDQVYNAYCVPSGMADYGPWQMIAYAKKYGVPIEKMDEVECNVRRMDRVHSSMNPKAFMQETLEEEASKAGFKDVFEYWKSYNPVSTWPVRAKGFLTPADGASAYIVCDSKIAEKLSKQEPIDLLGRGEAGTNVIHFTDPLEWTAHTAAFKEAYKNAGITGEDVDYLSAHSCNATMAHIVEPEMAGYFDPGTSWKAVLENRTLYSGDKPINTTGGRYAFGHAFSASAGAELYEIVKQMRGQAGKRQVKERPRIAVLQNEGASILAAVSVFRRRSAA